MAEAYGKLTGRPGICLVTRGPGATHASVGVHTAAQDSTPMILLVGQVARGTIGREGFQELDYRQVFGPIAKWATQVDDPARLPEVIARAFSLACSGRPGPVVVALPGGHAERIGRGARRGARGAGLALARCVASSTRLAELLEGCPAAAGDRRRGRLDGPGRARTSSPSRERPRFRSPPRSAARTTSTTRPRCTPAMPGSGWRRHWRDASPRPTCCWRSGAGSARFPRAATPCWRFPGPASAWCTCIPIPTSWGPSTSPSWGSSRVCPSSPRRSAPGPPGRRRQARRAVVAAAHAEYEANLHEARRAARGAAAGRRHGRAARAAGRRRDPHLRRGELHRLGSPLLRLPHAIRASSRRAAARWATAFRPRSPPRRFTPIGPSSAWPATVTF